MCLEVRIEFNVWPFKIEVHAHFFLLLQDTRFLNCRSFFVMGSMFTFSRKVTHVLWGTYARQVRTCSVMLDTMHILPIDIFIYLFFIIISVYFLHIHAARTIKPLHIPCVHVFYLLMDTNTGSRSGLQCSVTLLHHFPPSISLFVCAPCIFFYSFSFLLRSSFSAVRHHYRGMRYRALAIRKQECSPLRPYRYTPALLSIFMSRID